MEAFKKEITLVFFENLLMVKLWHWKTHNYSTHKATDELYTKINEGMDHFMEVLLGKSNERIHLSSTKTVALKDLQDQKDFIKAIQDFKSYLVGLDKNKAMHLMSNSDLFNIRDEILGDLNQFLYLLTLH
jgi:hypothetical protein